MNEQDMASYRRVIDLKQYVYCPRIYYYHTVLAQVRPTTYKMEEGLLVHKEEDAREKRRQLRTYGLAHGERFFHVPIQSTELGLSGEVDMVIQTEEEIIPVDFKNAKRVGEHFRLQLLAYGLMLAEQSSKRVSRGFLYLIPQRKAQEVRFTPRLKSVLQRHLTEMKQILETQKMPSATSKQARCVDCEFRRFCNDVL